MYGYVYKTTNLINGKIYIGQHKHSTWDENYKGSGTMLFKAFEKYGKNNFKCELLESVESQEELNKLEKFYIEKYNAKDTTIGYNIADGGIGGAHEPWNKGLSKNIDERIALYADNRNKLFQEKGSIGCFGLKGTLNKNSIESRGVVEKMLPEFEEYWQTHHKTEVLRHFHTGPTAYYKCIEILNLDENDSKRLAYLNDKKHKKRLNTINNNGTHNSVKIRCIETGEVYNSILEAKTALGLNGNSSIYAALDYGKKCRGYHWERIT